MVSVVQTIVIPNEEKDRSYKVSINGEHVHNYVPSDDGSMLSRCECGAEIA